MTPWRPAEVGMPLHEVDTPALVIELDALERNLARMAEAARAAGVRLRPHAKTHKCAVIARRQVALGAVGVCCQKVGEAEVLAHAGVDDILVSNEVVGARKLERLAALAREAQLAVCVDDPRNVRALSDAARRQGVDLQVLVEINVGADRCGVVPGEPGVALAAQVDASPGLRFAGLQAYHGRAQHIRAHAGRGAAIADAVAAIRATRDLLAARGLSCEVIAGAGTGSFEFEAGSGVYNELQPGSYVFMDADYARNLSADGSRVSDFEQSLFVYTTVMSVPGDGRAVVDAGLKALSVDSGMPGVPDLEGVSYSAASDEHGSLALEPGTAVPALGDKLRLVPGHCDPTVNLYDWFVCMRDGRVAAVWPIVARGAVY